MARETKTLHAPWWGTPQAPKSPSTVTILAEVLGADTRWIAAQLMKHVDLGKSGTPISSEEMAKSRLWTFRRMITEWRDARGTVLPLTETMLDACPEYDLKYIETEIEKLREPPVPVLPEDEAEAADLAEREQRRREAGWPETEVPTAVELAANSFRPALRQPVSWQEDATESA